MGPFEPRYYGLPTGAGKKDWLMVVLWSDHQGLGRTLSVNIRGVLEEWRLIWEENVVSVSWIFRDWSSQCTTIHCPARDIWIEILSFQIEMESINPQGNVLHQSLESALETRGSISGISSITSPEPHSVCGGNNSKAEVHIYCKTEHFVHGLWFVIIWVSASSRLQTFHWGTKNARPTNAQWEVDQWGRRTEYDGTCMRLLTMRHSLPQVLLLLYINLDGRIRININKFLESL